MTPSAKAPDSRPAEPIITLCGISVAFKTSSGGVWKRPGAFRAVEDLSLTIGRGESFSIVGESGSGKSTLGRVICGLLKPTAGSVQIAPAPDTARRGHPAVQMVFQDPFSALNPRMTLHDLLEEPLIVHRIGDSPTRRARVTEMIELVGLSRRQLDRYPHQFSGGQRQRIAIARALVTRPRILLADEPLSALDVSVQAQIINLLAELKAELGLTLVMISHDLSVVSFISDRIGVMKAGRLVESGSVTEIFTQPAADYTRRLIAAVPHPDPRLRAGYLGVEESAGAGVSLPEPPYAARLRAYRRQVQEAKKLQQTPTGERL